MAQPKAFRFLTRIELNFSFSGNSLGSSNRTIRIHGKLFLWNIFQTLRMLHCRLIEIRLTTTSTPPSTTTVRSTTIRATSTTVRRRLYTQSTSTSSYAISLEPSTEFELEFVTDFPGSHSLFYPGVESYQHHINYINSQSSFHESLRLRWLWLTLLLLLKVS